MAKRRRRRRRHIKWMNLLQVLFFVVLALVVIGEAVNSRRTDTGTEETAATTPDPVYKNSYDQSGFDKSDVLWSYEDDAYTSLKGIDVSYVQKDVDWQKVAAAGVQFAYIRAGYRGYSEGLLHTDDYFAKNMAGAADAGIPVGVYWVSHGITVPEVIAEAEYLYDLIKDYDLSYPVVFDMEQADESDRINTLSRGQKTMLAAAFVQAMRCHGFQVTIYGSQNWLQQDISMAVLQDEADFWLAAYDVEFPRFAYAYSCWQYSHTGTIDGISTLVDLDVMFVRK